MNTKANAQDTVDSITVTTPSATDEGISEPQLLSLELLRHVVGGGPGGSWVEGPGGSW